LVSCDYCWGMRPDAACKFTGFPHSPAADSGQG
jgi:hypothetical protein